MVVVDWFLYHPLLMSSENQKLYDQDIERIYVPLVTSPKSLGTEVMRGSIICLMRQIRS